MNWSYRKSISAGPFRMNFSKSGVSYFFGVKGARVNVSNRGTHVRLSYSGINYRQRISVQSFAGNPNAVPIEALKKEHNITSANIDQLTDTDSKEFISELNEKSKMISYLNWFGILPLAIYLFILIFDNQITFSNPYLEIELGLGIAIFLPLMIWLMKVDKKRF